MGELDPAYETPALPGDGGLTVVVCTAQPGSPAAERLAVLAGRHAGALPARAGQG